MTRQLWIAFTILSRTIGGGAAVLAKPAADLPVLLWFGNAPGDGLTSDGDTVVVNGTVADYANGVENVLAVIQSSGDFRFSTDNNTKLVAQRHMCVDFGTQFADRGMVVPFTDGLPKQCVDVTEPMHGYTDGSDIPIQNLRYGQSVHKLVRFGWTDGGYIYRVGYGTDMDMNGVLDSPPVVVACIAPQDPTQSCTRWLLAPEQNVGTAALFRFAVTNSGEGPAEPLGTFTMPFSETFTLE